MQPHGPGRAERKVIHIKPYWRGPNMAEAIRKPHVAGGARTSRDATEDTPAPRR